MTIFGNGFLLPNGSDLQALVELRNLNAAGGLTAQADGTRAAATELVNGLNEVSTVAGAADSVILPLAAPGTIVLLANAGASAMQVFARGSDTINGTAGATGVSQSNDTRALYFCAAAGAWWRLLGA